jgi:MFS family permease
MSDTETDSKVTTLDSHVVDETYDFVKHHNLSDADLSTKQHATATWKLDLYILPILCIIYFLQYLDKSLLNYAAAMGIKKNLEGNEFANLSTIFYAAYIFGEPFVAVCLQRYRLSWTLGIFVCCWGVVVACHAACKTYAELMIVRTLLGIFESSSAVGLIVISGMYYSKSQQAVRMGIWSVMAGTGTIVGGLLSFGFQHIRTTEFASWQILFLVIGVITCLFGILIIFFLPDNVHKAKFLNDDDKRCVLAVVKENQTGTKSTKFKIEQLKELFFGDKFTWLYFLLTLTSQIVTGAIGTFSVTITLTFGFDSYESALLQLPIGVLIIIIIMVATKLVAIYGHITYILTSMFIPTIIGAIVLLISPNRVGNIMALYLLFLGSCSITLIYVWISSNTSGTSKKFFRSGLTMIAFSIACIIGPQLFQAYSKPDYHPAKITILVTQIACIPITLFIGYLCKKENQYRDENFSDVKLPPNHEFLDMTDIENKSFRYSY